ncbi:MAG: hypothetical protein A2509_06935 [Candidatus Edwardsbacteria bacterium RIFOXYD12_FULL_50_11]|uniref:Bacterial toxin 44 domain-containing protein n=1 Tax=Candidatus Edwardsbacteria bacterium GWF2_54_11 TaxID=1817851 RepID=A0A1F5RGR4_9BACT|nr:MAG: hypothetical protein A2502_09680 [Candidatus Edwardsbacteria bacterium RifOxyC12_full_54_24]OGF06885.1 MAG: hypothetical protein A2273_01380 [Candidatus Edwardsbacteria bacterium RifOxyA12_full_54_48]OGF10835.1 MAG: hypothetical protein A3K15_06750 [Candidatus Edwardsbacteria bacterium GWE2_54_12]OGF13231.1 MAG: hypothetical protein A2024_09540 [Candidatus Edwardsbacteria bacterium GWF2_54_11]OGF15615.1 MAG: hypothetical protein A2509_06935 [Candidatus Edwardsbacteria bacterium RIFOXYD1
MVPDPDLFGVPKEGILSNPQRLNRYSYCLNNPYKYKDPTGKCGIDIHYVLTFNLAIDASYGKINSLNFSRDLSYANQSVDDIYGVNPFQGNLNSAVKNLINNFSSPYKKHFISTNDAIQLVEKSIETGNVADFGESLHSLQDSYRHPHRGLFVGLRFGHSVESIFDKKTPDRPYDENDPADVAIKDITSHYINKFINVNSENLKKEYPLE